MSLGPTFSPRDPRRRSEEALMRFVRGIETPSIRLLSGQSGDLLMVGASGLVSPASTLTGDYSLTGELTITNQGFILTTDVLQLLGTDRTRNLIGDTALAGFPVFVGQDEPAVASARLGKVDATGQVANIATTALSNSPPAGLYWVEAYILTTTADAGAGTLAVTAPYTDAVGATTATLIAAHALTGTGRSTGRALIQLASGDISYAVTITGAYLTSVYAVYVRVFAAG